MGKSSTPDPHTGRIIRLLPRERRGESARRGAIAAAVSFAFSRQHVLWGGARGSHQPLSRNRHQPLA